jgi:glutamate N-acetyltransferase/amino-acid N-acetyltransferase
LARKIAEDAEGASHLIQIDVVGTRTDEEARKIAKAVADSPLVKTAVYGADPNWGRICSAAGYAGVEFEEKNLSLHVNGTLLYDHGAPTPFDPATESKRIRENRDTHIELSLDLGKGKCRFWSCDLTVEYVRFNADYTT